MNPFTGRPSERTPSEPPEYYAPDDDENEPSATMPEIEKIARKAAKTIWQDCGEHSDYLDVKQMRRIIQDALTQAREPLVKALMKYGRHLCACAFFCEETDLPCDCGLEQLRRGALTGAKEKK